MEVELITGIIISILSIIGSLAYIKKKISSIRNLIGSVDDAIFDDRVTETEFRDIWKSFQTVISK